MKICIAGYGMVGKAHAKLLKPNHDVVVVDPLFEDFDTLIPVDVDAVIICVSTPDDGVGNCDMTNVADVIRAAPPVPILVKSTISYDGWKSIKSAFSDKHLAFSPEFLRAATAYDDLKNSKLMLIGGDEIGFWKDLFNTNIETANPEELILAKYARNSFLALKVSYFNQLYDVCEKLGVEYDAVAHYTGMDERIGYSHTYVTEQRGFGGHCFPKDVNAFLNTAVHHGTSLSILEEAYEYNERLKR